jgi:hypothetical protein
MHNQVLGALSLLYDEATTFSDDDIAVARALASVATIGLLHGRTPRLREILAEQLQSALTLRVVLEQAKGVIAERGGIGVDESFDRMAAYSRRVGRRLSDVATDVIERRIGPTDLDDLSASGS